MSDLKERLAAETLYEQQPDFTAVINGKSYVMKGATVTIARNPDGPEALAYIEALETQLAEAREHIREAANQFALYAYGHKVKQTEDGDEKSKRNQDWADRLFAFLTPTTSSCPRCGHTTDSEIHAFGCKEITP